MQLAPTAPVIVNGYDRENPMTSTQTAGHTRIDNRYDPLHRRVLKQVSTWDTGTSTWVLQKTVRFTYDGWNMIEEEQLQDSGSGFQPLAVTRHTWGTDVSGTLQGVNGGRVQIIDKMRFLPKARYAAKPDRAGHRERV
jgi:hypothetical protein